MNRVEHVAPLRQPGQRLVVEAEETVVEKGARSVPEDLGGELRLRDVAAQQRPPVVRGQRQRNFVGRRAARNRGQVGQEPRASAPPDNGIVDRTSAVAGGIVDRTSAVAGAARPTARQPDAIERNKAEGTVYRSARRSPPI
jgi:hypothetical protein